MKNKKWMKGVVIAAIAAMSVGMLAGCGGKLIKLALYS